MTTNIPVLSFITICYNGFKDYLRIVVGIMILIKKYTGN